MPGVGTGIHLRFVASPRDGLVKKKQMSMIFFGLPSLDDEGLLTFI